MIKLLHPELSYKVTGLCFQVQKELGRFCREKQYADRLEQKIKELGLLYQREFEIKNLAPNSPKGNKVDFLIENKMILETKAKRFVTKDDYFQTQRYLQSADLELGLIVNFRSSYLKPKRVLNSNYSGHSDKLVNLDRLPGYITLISVLIVGTIAVSITFSLILLGIGSTKTTLSLDQSKQAWGLAEACAEEALQQIKDSNPFTGTGNLTFGQGTCSYTVTSQGSQNRTITSTATVGTIIRKVKIIIDKITPNINITSWQEVADL